MGWPLMIKEICITIAGAGKQTGQAERMMIDPAIS